MNQPKSSPMLKIESPIYHLLWNKNNILREKSESWRRVKEQHVIRLCSSYLFKTLSDKLIRLINIIILGDKS